MMLVALHALAYRVHVPNALISRTLEPAEYISRLI
jgi:hypothetical protein